MRKCNVDCFAYKSFNSARSKCLVLTEMLCSKKKCPFYKTKEQYDKDIKMLEERRKQKE